MVQVRNLGKPVELAGRYYDEGADEVPPISLIVEHRIDVLKQSFFKR